MKENRLGPRQWAFVVMAGGAVCALPFASRQHKPTAEPAIDVAAALLPETVAPPAAVAPTATNQLASSKTPAAALPNWPSMPQSPFDELAQQKAQVIEAQPTEPIIPMQPLRPWISAPNMARDNEPKSNSMLAKTSANAKDAVAMASPWEDDRKVPITSVPEASSQIAQSVGQGRRQLSVTAGPADQYTAEEIAAKLGIPKPEARTQELVSAIVPAEELPPARSSVVLSSRPSSRPAQAQVRFGAESTPLPKLPEERRGHIIFQPRK